MVDFVVNTGQTRVELSKLMESVSRLGANTDALEAKLDSMGAQWAGTVFKMTGAARDAEARFRALSGEANALKTVLQSVDVLNRYSKAMLDINAAIEQSTLNAVKLESSVQLTNDGYRTAELVAKERLKTAEAGATAEVRSEEAFRRSAIALEQLATITGRLAAIENERVSGARAVAVEGQKQANATALLVEKTEQLNTAQGQKLATDKVQYDSAVRMATAQARQAAAIAETTQAIELLNSPEGRRLAQLKATQSALTQAATFNERMAATTSKLRAETEFLATAEGREQLQLRVTNQIARQASDEKVRHAAEAARLRREIEFLRSEEGKRILVLRQVAAEERRAAVSRAQGINLGNQLTSGMRAAIQGLRSSIGIYTSSTILFASAVFGLSRAFRSGLDAGVEFTAAMARARAVMAASPQEFAALQAQVEALGAATQFSSTQVAQATVELAKVGLSASQAITALRPVLDIATLGDVDIATAAKLATDVMFVFGKQVGDLTDISDVMATAIARSSTNVEELVKGLTYAGPAAHAAGISMRDTVAAMEALANAGIRGSRAGTALRMMIDRLADPTAKGAAALLKMGVSLTDLQGKAKSLTSVLGEFQAAQQKMAGPEFLAGLGDIFGVRQASAIANLISNADNMVKFRKELEVSSGASDKMVQSLRDVAKFDWENLTSAFQALQISVFQDNEFQIRGFIESLRHFFDFLNERIGDSGITRLESYITRLKHIGEVVAVVFAARYLFRFSEGLLTSAAALRKQALAYGYAADSAVRADMATKSYTATVIRNTVAVDASGAGLKAWAARAALANGSAAGLVSGVTKLRGALAIGGAVLGWAGIIASVVWGVWEIYKAFTDAGPKTSEELNKRTDEAKKNYQEMKAVSDQMMAQQEKVNFSRALEFQQKSVATQQAQITATEGYRDAAMAAAKSDTERALIAEKYALILGVMKDKLDTTTESLRTYQNQAAAGTGADPGAEATRVVLQMNEVRKQIDSITGGSSGIDIGNKIYSATDQARLDALKKQLYDLNMSLLGLADAQKKISEAGGMSPEQALSTGQQIMDEAATKSFNEHADAVLKDKNKLDEAAQAAREADQAYQAAKKGVEDAERGIGNMTEALDKFATAVNNGKVVTAQFAGMLGDLAKSSHDLEEKFNIGMMAPAARTAMYRSQLEGASATLAGLKASAKAQGVTDPARDPRFARIYNEQLKDRDAAAQALGLFSKSASGGTSTKSVDTFLSNLRAQLNPIAEAANKARESIEKLASIKGLSGNERGLLSGQIEFDSLKSQLEFSPDSLQEQIDSIDAWKQKELALADAIKDTTIREQVRAQILRQSQSLTNQRIDQMESEKFELIDYNNALRDQDAVLQQQMDDRVAAIGIGQQAGQQQQALTKLNRDYVNNSIKLQREHTRALDTLRAKGDQAEIDKENRKYAQKEQDLKDSYARQVVITEDGYRDLLAAQGNVKLGVQGGLSQVIEDGTNIAGKMQQAVVGGFNDMTDAVVNFAKTGKFSLKDFALNFAEMMMRMELAALEAKLAMAILGLFAPSGNYAVDTGGASGINFGGMYGSGSGTFNGIAGANGLAFDKGTVTAMAKGGLINRPTLFPMATGGLALGGEAGTEAIMPLERMSNSKLGVNIKGAGGGGDTFNFQTNVNVNSDGSSTTSSTADDSKAGRQLAKMIEAKTKEIIVRATQPGGILWKQKMGVTA